MDLKTDIESKLPLSESTFLVLRGLEQFGFLSALLPGATAAPH